MSLDVELVIRTEDVFGITIDDTDAAQIHTAGDLYEAVWRVAKTLPLPQNRVPISRF